MNLSSTLYVRFELRGCFQDLKNAIRCNRLAIILAADNQNLGRKLLNRHGELHLVRYSRTGELEDIDKAIECLDQAALQTPDSQAEKPYMVNTLGKSYLDRFKHTGKIADVNMAISYCGQAVQLTVDSHPSKPNMLNNCGNAYLVRFERIGALSDIGKAIHYHDQAVQLTRDDQAPKPMWLYNLGSSYLARFDRLDDVADIDKVIQCWAQAVLLTPQNDSERPARLNALAISHTRRFGLLGERADVDKAIEYRVQAVQLTPTGNADKPDHLDDLGRLYLDRFQLFGEVIDVERAINYLRQVVQLTSDGHPNKPNRLSNLGNSYMRRFERLGKLTDADKAVHCHRQALSLVPDGHECQPALLNDLGGSYESRFERLREPADLENAIDCLSQAVLLTPDGNLNKTVQLHNLGNCHMIRFRLSKGPADIENAIRYQNQAVLLTPDGRPDKPSTLNTLGSSYLTRFEHSGEVADVGQAINCLSQAVLLAPDSHADKPLWLCNLGSSYMRRFEHNGNSTDIDEAISYQNQAALLTPDDHAGKPTQLFNLGRSYSSRFNHLGNLLDLEACTISFAHAAQFDIGDPNIRFDSARAWAMTSRLLCISPEPAYQRIMELVSKCVWLGSTINQRYDSVAQIGEIVVEAAASAISVGALDRAVEWLEQGRSVVWKQILQLRTPFDDLAEVDPALAEQLRETGHMLERAGSRSAEPSLLSNQKTDMEADAQKHRHLAAEWDRLLETARLLPGFNNFMRPAAAKDLMYAAKGGPIVVINVDQSRCDALVIFPNSDRVAHVPLKSFSPEKAVEARAQLLRIIGSRGTRDGGFKRVRPSPMPENTFRGMLASLWSDVVKPILDFLGYKRKLPVDELPHVTWCTTGALSFLPLHAAGCYDGSQPSAFELLVSSYTPTLSALLVPNPPSSEPHAGILAVGQEHTKGMASLPYTVQELETIKELAKGIRYSQLDNDNATVDAVLSTMDKYSWVHLACHASQNSSDPSQSAFHLRDGNLLLSDIIKRSFKNKGLAFLSACQTATGDENLPDEAVHLAAGMLMSGYPSVIATMWAINDEDAPEVARQVYANLLQDGNLDHTRASRALHKAVASLREKVGEQAFKQWVPFVHIGS